MAIIKNRFEFPWPPRELSPNCNVSWKAKIIPRKEYKELWRSQSFMLGVRPAAFVSLNITFFPPNNKSRDLDNLLASIKLGLDGLAQGLNIDDKLFRPITIDIGEPVKGGNIVVILEYEKNLH